MIGSRYKKPIQVIKKIKKKSYAYGVFFFWSHFAALKRKQYPHVYGRFIYIYKI